MIDRRKASVWPAALLWAMLVGCAGGDAGCAESALDRLEVRLRADPGRAGKVGTLRALEVRQRAHQVAYGVAQSAGGPCDIGWRMEEAFGVVFELGIDVQRGSWRRQWNESGRWEKDEEGRWGIEAEIEFSDGDRSQGERNYRIFSDEEGFWEFLGPEVVARYRADGDVERRWREEFSGRFSELMQMVSPGWEDVGGGRFEPGSADVICEPQGGSEARSWRPILLARTGGEEAFIERDESPGEDGFRCRRLMARYGLEGGGRMNVAFSECVGAGPEKLKRDVAQRRVVEVDRAGDQSQRSQMARQLDRWIEAGLVEAVGWKR